MGKTLTEADIVRSLSPKNETWTTFDGACPGLMLRVGKTTSAFEIRMNRIPLVRRTIGPVSEVSLETAREITRRARKAHDLGVEIDAAWVRNERQRIGDGNPPIPVDQDQPSPGQWSVKQILSQHLVELHRNGRSLATVADARKNATIVSSSIADRIAKNLSTCDLQAVIDDIHREKPVAARRGGEAIRRAFRWAVQVENRAETGLEKDITEGLRMPRATAPRNTQVAKRKRAPQDRDVARIIAVCRSGMLPPALADAIELTCLSGMQPAATTMALLQDIDHDVWVIPHQRMRRAGELHLPVKPFQHLLKSHGHDTWVFPHHGIDYGGRDKHIHSHAITVTLRQIDPEAPYNVAFIRAALDRWLKTVGTDLKSLHEPNTVPSRDAGVAPEQYLSDRKIVFDRWRRHLDPMIAEEVGILDRDRLRASVAVVRGRFTNSDGRHGQGV